VLGLDEHVNEGQAELVDDALARRALCL